MNCYINPIIRCPFPVPPTITLLGPDVDHLRFVALFFVGVAVVLALTAVGWLEALLSPLCESGQFPHLLQAKTTTHAGPSASIAEAAFRALNLAWSLASSLWNCFPGIAS